MSTPEQDLHTQFCLYGSFYLSHCRINSEPADPKIYDTIHKYLEGRNLEDLPTPDEGSLAERELSSLKKEMDE